MNKLIIFFLLFTPTLVNAGQIITAADVTYLGKSTIPWESLNPTDYGYGMAHDPATNNLLIGCHDVQRKGHVATIDIPAPTTNGQPNVSNLVQGCTDLTGGTITSIAADVVAWDIMLVGNEILMSASSAYQTACSDVPSHGKGDAGFSTFDGWSTLKADTNIARPYTGYLFDIPVEWQAAFGGTAIAGSGPRSIITCSSNGPSAVAFTPSDVVPPDFNTTVIMPKWSDTDPYAVAEFDWKLSTTINGGFFPSGTDSVVFVMRQGAEACYGTGGTNGVCYDPCSSASGTHSYPYNVYLLVYDANDLLAGNYVYREKILLPDIPVNGCATVGGAAWDDVNKILYIKDRVSEMTIWHYAINITSEPPPPPPPTDPTYECGACTCTCTSCTQLP